MGQSHSRAPEIVTRRSPGWQAVGSSRSAAPERGPLAIFAPILRGRRLAPVPLCGPNGTGKSSTATAVIKDGLMTDAEFREALKNNRLEAWHFESTMVYELRGDNGPEKPKFDGVSLLSNDGYLEPTDVSQVKRFGFLPEAAMDHGTRATTAITNGVPCVMLVYRTKNELQQVVEYLAKSSKQRPSAAGPSNCATPCFDVQRLRLGLELIGKRVDKSTQGNDMVLQTVFNLRPEEIKIPRKCWEKAGTIECIRTDINQPLEVQLEEISKALWRVGTLVEESVTDGDVSGNRHVAFLTGLFVTLPCPKLEGVLLLDYVGYIPGDAACEEAHGLLPHSAGNILTCAGGRDQAVKDSLAIVNCSSSLLLNKLVNPDPSTPPLLLIVAPERTRQHKEAGDSLVTTLSHALQTGDAAAVGKLLTVAPQMLQQLTTGVKIEKAAPAPGDTQTSAQMLSAMHHLLTERQILEVKHVANYAMSAMKRVAMRKEAAMASADAADAADAAGGRSSDLESDVTDDDLEEQEEMYLDRMQAMIAQAQRNSIDESSFTERQKLQSQHRIEPISCFFVTYANCKQLLLDHQQQLQEQGFSTQELITRVAEITGLAVVNDFVRRSKEAFEQRRQQAAAAAGSRDCRSLDSAVLSTMKSLESDMLATLQKAPAPAGTQNPVAYKVLRLQAELAGQLQQGRSGSSLQQQTTAAFQGAVAEWQKPHLKKCTVERGLAEGLPAIIKRSVLDSKVPNWQQELNLDEPDKLVGPDRYSKGLQGLLRGSALRRWLLSDRNTADCDLDANDDGPAEVLHTIAAYMLSPLAVQGTLQGTQRARRKFIRLPEQSELQPLREKHRRRQASALQAAQLHLADLCAKIEDALRLPSGAEASDPGLVNLLAEKQAEVRRIIAAAFASFRDITTFQATFLLPAMELAMLSCITTQQALIGAGTHIINRLQLIQKHYPEFLKAAEEAAEQAVAKHVAWCWDMLQQDLNDNIIMPVAMWHITKTQQRQQVQQVDGLCAALRDVAVLQCHAVASRSSRGSSRRSRKDAAVDAARELGIATASLPALHLMLDADASGPEPYGLLPSGQQLTQLAEMLHAAAAAAPAAQLPRGAASSLVEVAQQRKLLEQCAEKLQLQRLQAPGGSGALDPTAVLALWLGALPANATVEQLYEVLCIAQPGGSSSSNAEAALNIGSEGYLKYLAQLLPGDCLPWQLQPTKKLVSDNCSALPSHVQLLLSQPVSALPPWQRVKLAQMLYKHCHRYKGAVLSYVHNQRLVDALVLPQRLQLLAGPAGNAAGADAAAVLQQMPKTALFTTAGSISGSSSSSSASTPQPEIPMVRVVSKSQPIDRLANKVRLLAEGPNGADVAMLDLDLLGEYLLCQTRVHARDKSLNHPTQRQWKALNSRAPPVVLLSALLLLQQEEAWQQQRRDCILSDAAGGRQLHMPVVQKATVMFKGMLKMLQANRSSGSSSSSSLPAQMLQEERWEVCEARRGGTRFIYRGMLPAGVKAIRGGVAGGSSSSGGGGVHVLVFDQYHLVAQFLNTGKLPSPDYLNTAKHKRLLLSVGIDGDSTSAGRAGAPAAAERASSSAAAAALPAAARSASPAVDRNPADLARMGSSAAATAAEGSAPAAMRGRAAAGAAGPGSSFAANRAAAVTSHTPGARGSALLPPTAATAAAERAETTTDRAPAKRNQPRRVCANPAASQTPSADSRRSKRRASAAASAAVTDTLAAEAESDTSEDDSDSDDADEPAAKRTCRAEISIGEAVSESPGLRRLAGQTVGIYVLKSPRLGPCETDTLIQIKLTEEGAYYPASSGRLHTTVNQLLRKLGYSKLGWANIFLADEVKTCWSVIKKEIQDRRDAA